MSCESQGGQEKVGDKHLTFWENGTQYGASYGLMQIRFLRNRPKPKELLQPTFNVKYAALMYKAQGWSPWTCAKKLKI